MTRVYWVGVGGGKKLPGFLISKFFGLKNFTHWTFTHEINGPANLDRPTFKLRLFKSNNKSHTSVFQRSIKLKAISVHFFHFLQQLSTHVLVQKSALFPPKMILCASQKKLTYFVFLYMSDIIIKTATFWVWPFQKKGYKTVFLF